MGNYQQHVIFGFIVSLCSTMFGLFVFDMGVWNSVLACMLGVLAAILPDLDHDDSIPIREVFNVVASIFPFIIVTRFIVLHKYDLVTITVIFVSSYLFIRIVVSWLFKKLTVHRGMFHSTPAVLIVGLTVFHIYFDTSLQFKLYLSISAMAGFLSHLVLDELSSVGFDNGRIKANKFSGSALDFRSKSVMATSFTYALLIILASGVVLRWLEIIQF